MPTKTITMTHRAPVEVDEAAWPVVAKSYAHDGREHQSQANRQWRLFVRANADGRHLVYGIYTTQRQGEADARRGVVVDPGGDVVAAIRSVGEGIGASLATVQACIADLPAEAI